MRSVGLGRALLGERDQVLVVGLVRALACGARSAGRGAGHAPREPACGGMAGAGFACSRAGPAGGRYGHCNLLTPRSLRDRVGSAVARYLPWRPRRSEDSRLSFSLQESSTSSPTLDCAASVRSYVDLSRAPGIDAARDRHSLVQQHGRSGGDVQGVRPARGGAARRARRSRRGPAAAGPAPSEPSTSTTRPVQSDVRVEPGRAGLGTVDPGAPPAWPRARKSARLRTRATRRCSTAPADARQTAGVTSAARRSGITTPVAPAHSALRQIGAEVLRVLDLVERDHQRLSPARARSRGVGVGIGLDLADEPWWSGEPHSSLELRRRTASTGMPGSPATCRGGERSSAAQTRRTCRRPRSASRTALRP